MKTSESTPVRVAIFGGTSDIAVAVARRFAEAGAKLVLVGRDQVALGACAADLKVRGAREVVVQGVDFAALDNLPPSAKEAWDAFAGLDVALVAYGSLPDQIDVQTSPQSATAALTLNFTSPALLLGCLAPLFEAQGHGTIAAITSVAGDRGRKSNYVYGAAKGGLQRFLEGLRHRMYASKVTVLDIRPGFVATQMTAHLQQGGPLWATPDQIATDIIKGIEKRRAVVYTPWFWTIILAIVRSLPRPVFHRSSL